MQIIRELNVDVAETYPVSLMFMSSELNNNSLFLRINLLFNKQPLSIAASDVITATIIVNNILITDERPCTRESENKIRVNISNDNLVTIRPGKMRIQIKIASANGEVYILPLLSAVIFDDIKNSAEITSESYGTTADAVREVIAARGSFATLRLRFDNVDLNISDLANQMLNLPAYKIVTGNAFDTVTDINKLYKTYYLGTYWIFGFFDAENQWRFEPSSGIELRRKVNDN